MRRRPRPGLGPGGVELFLRRLRWRLAARQSLHGLLWAFLAAEVWLWGTILVNRLSGRDLPILNLGLPLAGVLLVRAVFFTRLEEAAGMADRRLGLKDRLTSYLDFTRRAEIPRDYREAQREETAAALGLKDPARALPFRYHHWLGVPLFLALMILTYFNPLLPPMPFVVVPGPTIHRRGAPRGRAGGSATTAGPEADVARQAPPSTPPEARDDRGTSVAPGGGEEERPTSDEEGKGETAAGAGGEPDRDRNQAAAPPGNQASVEGGAGRRGKVSEPLHLYSETVGKSLTPVAEGARPGRFLAAKASLSQVLPKGRVAFDLIPRGLEGAGGTGGAGGTVGSRREPGEIIIDFDSIPEEYREFVRRYFGQIGMTTRGG